MGMLPKNVSKSICLNIICDNDIYNNKTRTILNILSVIIDFIKQQLLDK